jgi:hypothetical protein
MGHEAKKILAENNRMFEELKFHYATEAGIMIIIVIIVITVIIIINTNIITIIRITIRKSTNRIAVNHSKKGSIDTARQGRGVRQTSVLQN